MRAAPMIVVHESSQMAVQTGFSEYDHVVQALPPNGADHPLDVSSLPGRPGRREHLFDPIAFTCVTNGCASFGGGVNGAVGPGSASGSGSLSKFLSSRWNIPILMCASTPNIQGRNRVR